MLLLWSTDEVITFYTLKENCLSSYSNYSTTHIDHLTHQKLSFFVLFHCCLPQWNCSSSDIKMFVFSILLIPMVFLTLFFHGISNIILLYLKLYMKQKTPNILQLWWCGNVWGRLPLPMGIIQAESLKVMPTIFSRCVFYWLLSPNRKAPLKQYLPEVW